MVSFRFGPFSFDVTTEQLSDNEGRQQILRPQSAQILHYLLQREGQIVSKDELIRELWPNEHVNDQAVFQAFNQLRKALGDQPSDPTFIKTIPRKGYCWICPVEKVDAQLPVQAEAWSPPHPEAPRPNGKFGALKSRKWIWVVMALAVVLGWLGWRRPWAAPPARPAIGVRPKVRVAFLPFVNQTGSSQNQWVELGLMDMAAGYFTDHQHIDAVPVNRVLKALDDFGLQRDVAQRQKDYQQILTRMGVDWVVGATVKEGGDGFRLDYRAQPAQGPIREGAFDLQDLPRLAMILGQRLEMSLGESENDEPRLFSKNELVNQAYAKGMQLVHEDEPGAAAPYFEVCIDQEPHAYWARYQLGDCYFDIGRVKDALVLLSEALQGAQETKDLSLEAETWESLAHILVNQERWDEALNHLDQAALIWTKNQRLERVAQIQVTRAFIYEQKGDFEAADGAYDQARTIFLKAGNRFELALIHGLQGLSLSERGKLQEAVSLLEEAYRVQMELEAIEEAVATVSYLGHAYWDQDAAIARSYFERELELALQHGKKRVLAFALFDLGQFHKALGDENEAYRLFGQGLDLARERDDSRSRVELALQLTDLAALKGEMKKAETYALEALTVADALGMRTFKVNALVYLIGFSLEQGNRAAATPLIEQGIVLHREVPSLDFGRIYARWLYESGQFQAALDEMTAIKQHWPHQWDEIDQDRFDTFSKALATGRNLPLKPVEAFEEP